MATLFLSHSSRDRVAAETVAAALRERGYDWLFLDVDLDQGIAAGSPWERTLYAQLRAAQGVVYLASPASLTSPWCFAELAIARFLGKPIFPVLIEGGDRHPLLGDAQWVDATADDDAWTRLARGLVAAGLDPGRSVRWDATRVPYPGLAAFGEEDAGVFFGRRAETQAALELLESRAPAFVAVSGPSGSGKSSLVRAGVLPRLRRRHEWVVVPPLRPGARPLQRLARGLADAFQARGSPLAYADVVARLEAGARALADLAEDLILSGERTAEAVLVVVDQAEELLRAPPSAHAGLLRLLHTAVGEDSPVSIVAAVRSEFLADALQRSDVATAPIRSLPVPPLDPSRLSEVIKGPADRAGLQIDDAVVERMIHDTAGGDALPLLAYTLRLLWELYEPAERVTRPVTLAEYEAIGGVEGALRRRADAARASLPAPASERLFATLARLADLSSDGRVLRRRVALRNLAEADREVVRAFEAERLLTVDEGTLEVAHEALLRTWEPLTRELAARAGDLRLRSQIERLAGDWVAADRDPRYLLPGERVRQVLQLPDWEHDLDESARAFVKASRQVAHAREEQVRRTQAARREAAIAFEAVRVDPGHAAVPTLRAAALDASVAEVGSALRTVLASARGRWVVRDESPVTAVAISPDGTAVVSGGTDGAWQLRDRQGKPSGARVPAHDGELIALAVAQDGSVHSAGRDGVVRVWHHDGWAPSRHVAEAPRVVAFAAGDEAWGDALVVAADSELVEVWSDGRLQRSFGPFDTVSVALAADRETFAVGTSEGRVIVGRVGEDPTREVSAPHRAAVTALAFAPDGQTLASGSQDGEVRLWEPAWMRDPVVLRGHAHTVRALAFSRDGGTLVSGSLDGTVRAWSRHGLDCAPPLTGHASDVNAVAFGPDGTLYSGGADGTVRAWRSGQSVPWHGHASFIRALAVSPDGATIASAGDDALRWWDATGAPAGPAIPGRLHDLAFGELLAGACGDGSVVLCAPRGGVVTGPFRAHDDAILGVRFSPDGRRLATVGRDQELNLWALDGTRIAGPIRHDDAVQCLAFAACIATGAADGTIRLFDRDGRQLGDPQPAHTGPIEELVLADRHLWSASADGTLALRDLDGNVIGPPMTGHHGAVWALAVRADGKLVATGGADATVRTWLGGTVEDWVRALRERASPPERSA